MPRRFDEQEVALILREATRIERGSDAGSGDLLHPGAGEGLTLAELKDIATEAGIDPSRVDVAARSLAVQPQRSPFRLFLGAPAQIRLQSEIPAKLDERDLSEALLEIRSVMSVQGTSGVSRGGLEWVSENEFGGRYVTIAQTSTGTRLDVTGDFGNAARGAAGVGAVVAGAGAVGMTAAVAAVGAIGWALAPVVAAGVVWIPRWTAGRLVRRESQKLSKLASRLRALFSRRATPGDGEEEA